MGERKENGSEARRSCENHSQYDVKVYNMNDHINETNTPEDGLTPEELTLLKEALDTAWPPPEKSLRDGVMAQIRRERAMAKKRALRNRVVKYGSLAACLLLVTMVGIRVLPAMNSKSADMAAADRYTLTAGNTAPAEAAPETAAQGYSENEKSGKNDGEPMQAVPGSTVSASAEDGGILITEEAVSEEALPETEAETLAETSAPYSKLLFSAAPAETEEECAVAECEAEGMEEYADAVETCAADAAVNTACAHSAVFADSYHTIPEMIIACTGEDVYLAWLDGTEGCDRNIAEYLNYMEENSSVLLSDIEMVYDATDLWYWYDWDFGLLESGDSDAVEEYYRNGGNFSEMVKRDTEYRFKLALLDEMGAEMNVDVCAWSIADLVESENITLSALTEIYEKSADGVTADYPGYAPQQYDLAALHDYAFSAANDEETPPDSIAQGRHEDEMFRMDFVK